MGEGFLAGATLGGAAGVVAPTVRKIVDRALGGYVSPKLAAKSTDEFFEFLDPKGKIGGSLESGEK
jgi:hypothetical protein